VYLLKNGGEKGLSREINSSGSGY